MLLHGIDDGIWMGNKVSVLCWMMRLGFLGIESWSNDDEYFVWCRAAEVSKEGWVAFVCGEGRTGDEDCGDKGGFFFFCNLTDGRLMKSSHGCAQEKSSLVLLAPFGSYCSTTEIHICNIVYWSSLYRAATAGICPSAITSFTLKPPLITSLLR